MSKKPDQSTEPAKWDDPPAKRLRDLLEQIRGVDPEAYGVHREIYDGRPVCMDCKWPHQLCYCGGGGLYGV